MNRQNLQQQKSVNSTDSNNHLIPISPSRKLSGLLRRKSRLIRNAARLTPLFPNMNSKRSSCVSNGSLAAKRQISSLSEVEIEIDQLLA